MLGFGVLHSLAPTLSLTRPPEPSPPPPSYPLAVHVRARRCGDETRRRTSLRRGKAQMTVAAANATTTRSGADFSGWAQWALYGLKGPMSFFIFINRGGHITALENVTVTLAMMAMRQFCPPSLTILLTPKNISCSSECSPCILLQSSLCSILLY